MLRKIILSLTLTTLPFFMCAKMAKWLEKPIYESIIVRDNGLMEVCKDNKYGLMRPSGQLIVPIVYDDISQFSENLALLYKDGKFFGITDRTGKILDLSSHNYSIPYPELGYSEGYLVVKNASGRYQFLNDEAQALDVNLIGSMATVNAFAKAFPFFESFAVVEAYENPAKPDKTFPAYVSLDNKRLYKFPSINPTDINFLSSFHDGEALAIIKKKFYFVRCSEPGHISDLEPIMIEVPGAKKPILIELTDKEVPITEQRYGFMLEAKNGIFKFDKYLRLTAYRLMNGEWVEREFPEKPEKESESNFTKFTDESVWGLKYLDQEILPPQFDQVRSLRGDNAVVGLNGKYGIITIDKDADFSFKINNNEHIGFTHKFFECPATLIMPTFIDPSKTSFSSVSPGFDIKKETRSQSSSFEGNYVSYDCRIAIPEQLTNNLTEDTYQFTVRYEDLISPVYSVPVTEWYVKLYEVDMPEGEISLGAKDSTFQVEFELNTRDANTGSYYKTVDVKTLDPLYSVNLKQISEDHYLLTLDVVDSDTDKLPFKITVTESGCPTIEFPYEAVFSPVTKKNTKRTVTINPIL